MFPEPGREQRQGHERQPVREGFVQDWFEGADFQREKEATQCGDFSRWTAFVLPCCWAQIVGYVEGCAFEGAGREVELPVEEVGVAAVEEEDVEGVWFEDQWGCGCLCGHGGGLFGGVRCGWVERALEMHCFGKDRLQ